MASGEFIIPGETLMDKTPVSSQMQETVEVVSCDPVDAEESAEEELDLHVCGKCKAEFTNIQLYVDHKRVVCSKRSPAKQSSQGSPKAKKHNDGKQIISSTSAVTAIMEPQEHSFCETVIEEGVVVDDHGSTEEAQQEIIRAAKASENQDVTEKPKQNKTKKSRSAQASKTDNEFAEVAESTVGPGPFKCTVCDKEFDRPETLVVHQFMHKKFHQCNDCKRSFVSEDNLKKHQKEFKHVFKCKICMLEFASQDACKSHETSHTRQHECIDCKKKFYTEKTLERHREKVLHNLPCEQCGKICRDKHALTKHQESHTRIKSHLCDWEGCERGFRSASELGKHKKCVHLGIKEHKCEECGKEFARKDKLNRHTLIHSPNRPTYPCPFKTFTGCVKTFYRKDKLQRHIFAHSKEKPYKCDTCSKLFARKDNLTEHMRIHTGEFKHRCPVCNKGMGGPKKLLLHVQLKHSGVNTTIHVDKPTMVGTTATVSMTSQDGAVTTATADASAATWVQENIASDKPDEEVSKAASTPESCPEIVEVYSADQAEGDQQDEGPQQQQQPLSIEIQVQQPSQTHVVQQVPQTQQHKPHMQQAQHQGQTQHDKDTAMQQQQRARHQQVLQQHVIQQQVPPPPTDQPSRPPPPLQQQHTLPPASMVVHQQQQPPTTATRVAIHYLANNNNTTSGQQTRGHYVPALHQGVPNVTQSETALLHEVLSELATRSLFNS